MQLKHVFRGHRPRGCSCVACVGNIDTESDAVAHVSRTPTQRIAKPTAVTPDGIEGHLSPFSRLPLNVGRHLLRSELIHRKVPVALVDALMGHWVAGREPMGRFSTLSPIEYKRVLVPVLEEIQTELGWTPLRGLG